MAMRLASLTLTTAAACGLAFCGSADAATHHRMTRHNGSAQASRVSYAHRGRYSGYRALVSDGSGSGYGFSRLPPGYVVAGNIHRARQRAAIKSAVLDDAIDSANPYGFDIYGDSVYGYGNGANYGVFSGAGAYGTPYFAGFYGPGDGADYGPFGHAYAD